MPRIASHPYFWKKHCMEKNFKFIFKYCFKFLTNNFLISYIRCFCLARHLKNLIYKLNYKLLFHSGIININKYWTWLDDWFNLQHFQKSKMCKECMCRHKKLCLLLVWLAFVLFLCLVVVLGSLSPDDRTHPFAHNQSRTIPPQSLLLAQQQPPHLSNVLMNTSLVG